MMVSKAVNDNILNSGKMIFSTISSFVIPKSLTSVIHWIFIGPKEKNDVIVKPIDILATNIC